MGLLLLWGGRHLIFCHVWAGAPRQEIGKAPGPGGMGWLLLLLGATNCTAADEGTAPLPPSHAPPLGMCNRTPSRGPSLTQS